MAEATESKARPWSKKLKKGIMVGILDLVADIYGECQVLFEVFGY
jgi:hypothetical protein